LDWKPRTGNLPNHCYWHGHYHGHYHGTSSGLQRVLFLSNGAHDCSTVTAGRMTDR